MLSTCSFVITMFSNYFLIFSFFIYNSQTTIKLIFMHDPFVRYSLGITDLCLNEKPK